MPISQENFNKNLYNLLKTQGYDPEPLDSKGKTSAVPNEADVFKISIGNKEHAYVTIDDAQQLKVYYDDSLIEETDNSTFRTLTRQLKKWAQRKQLGFELVNRDHLQADMAMREHMKQKEKLGEGYYPMGKKSSYNDSVPQVKILLQHTRQIEEGEQRFRNIAKIFVENTNGERFLLPTVRPGLARVYARHIAEGGTPYDEKGTHITSLVEEYTKMAGFVRATRNGQFNESAQKLVNEGLNHYQSLRETLSKLTSRRGYNNYFESYTPILNEVEETQNLNELFVQETLDPRIESVLPILNRLSKNISEMREVTELDEWAQSVLEVEDETTKTLAEPASEMLDEAPGAETLAHNDQTEKSNLKAFDLEEEVKVKYEVVDKDGKRVGTWDGIVFKAYDKTKFPAGTMEKIPPGAKVDKESGPLDDKHMAMSKAGLEEDSLDEINLGKTGKALAATAGLAAAGIGGQHMAKMPSIDQIQNKPGFAYELTQNLAKDPNYRESMQIYYEVLKDPEATEKKKVLAKKYNTDQYFKVWMDTVNQARKKEPTIWNKIKNWFATALNEEELDEAQITYFHVVVDGTSKGKFKDEAKAKEMVAAMKKEFPNKKISVEKKDEFSEDLDANQKRVGQLGPTDPVGKNEKNLRGKLVGASESVEFHDLRRLAGI